MPLPAALIVAVLVSLVMFPALAAVLCAVFAYVYLVKGR